MAELNWFLAAYARVVKGSSVRGNLVPDPHVATILLQHGFRTLYSNDRDFRKFEFLDVKNPFDEERRSPTPDPPIPDLPRQPT